MPMETIAEALDYMARTGEPSINIQLGDGRTVAVLVAVNPPAGTTAQRLAAELQGGWQQRATLRHKPSWRGPTPKGTKRSYRQRQAAKRKRR